MNRTIALAALASALGGPVLADDITVDPNPFTSSRSRADVAAEMHQFRRQGNSPWSIAHDPLRDFRSGRSRAEVTADYLRNREEVRAMHQEDSGAALLARSAPATATVHARIAMQTRQR